MHMVIRIWLVHISFLSLNLISDYSTQQLSAVNDGPGGGGGGPGIYLDHNQYSASSSSRGGIIKGINFGSNTIKSKPPGEKLDFSSPSLYTNSSGGLRKFGFLHIFLALAISAVTSVLYSYSQFYSPSPCWSYYKMNKNKKFMQQNVDIRIKNETDHIQNIQYLKKYAACKKSSSGSSRNGNERNQNKKGSMVCVLCI